MKRLWIATGLIALIIVTTLVGSMLLRTFCDDLVVQLTYAEILVTNEQLSDATAVVIAAQHRWSEREKLLSALLRHEDVDDIGQVFQQVMVYLAYQDVVNYHAASGQLQWQLTTLHSMESLTLSNLF